MGSMQGYGNLRADAMAEFQERAQLFQLLNNKDASGPFVYAMLKASCVPIAQSYCASWDSTHTVLQDLEEDLHWDVYLFLGMS